MIDEKQLHDEITEAREPANPTEWAKQIIEGPGGMNDFEMHEIVVWHESDRVCAAEWAVRCLANPSCEGSAEVLEAIMDRRRQVAAEDLENVL